MHPLAHYEQLAALFEYPQPDYPIQVRRLCERLTERYPLAASQLRSFANALPSEGEVFSPEALDDVQEIFTRSFDVQSITTLGVGYVMFGDDYKRGELLVNLNREHQEAGIDCGCELPDHLPNVLRLLAVWRDRETVVEFVEEILHPALQRMIREFGTKRMEQRNRLYRRHFKTLIASSPERGTMFREPLVALVAVLNEDFALSETERPEVVSDFLRSIDRELDIEDSEGRPAQSRSLP
jgi:nitrate reductase assembly molybdenum cofactor insertion protein NarJ